MRYLLFISLLSLAGCQQFNQNRYEHEIKGIIYNQFQDGFKGNLVVRKNNGGYVEFVKENGSRCQGPVVYKASTNVGRATFYCTDRVEGQFAFKTNGQEGKGKGNTHKGHKVVAVLR